MGGSRYLETGRSGKRESNPFARVKKKMPGLCDSPSNATLLLVRA